MLKNGMFVSVLCVPLIVSCGFGEKVPHVSYEEFAGMFSKKEILPVDIAGFFPKTEHEAQEFVTYAKRKVDEQMKQFLAISAQQRTYVNTVKAFDSMQWQFGSVYAMLQTLMLSLGTSPFKDACHQGCEELQLYSVEAFDRKEVYDAFDAYVKNGMPKENLSDSEHYMIDEIVKSMKRSGLALPEAELAKVRELRKELGVLALTFEKNIDEDTRVVFVTREALAGLDENFIAGLKKDEKGRYKLGCDTPTFFEVRQHCQNEQTRKDLHRAFWNRGYPVNDKVLHSIIAKSDQIAKLLGFASAAALDLDSEIAKTPERAEAFINELVSKGQSRIGKHLEMLKAELPVGMSLDASGKIKPWDRYYLESMYKKHHFALDNRAIAEYFPVQHVLKNVFDIYQSFLGLSFVPVKTTWTWHEDVQLLQVKDTKSGDICGYLLLDLYPRDGKNGHAFCCGLIPAGKEIVADGTAQTLPSLVFVLANFPKATADRPALLTHVDIETLLHELGHAMDALLGGASLRTFSSSLKKLDFVEMPSQLFEEWAFDKECLKKISKHYKTGQPLPDTIIDTMIGLRNFDRRLFLLGQNFYALVALNIYKNGADKDIDALFKRLDEKTCPYLLHDDQTHQQASFGHLIGYGARYYSYMWSKVYSMAILEELKKTGLLTVNGGKLFIDKVLSHGSSIDPEKLLENYLGGKPSMEPFLKNMGIAEED